MAASESESISKVSRLTFADPHATQTAKRVAVQALEETIEKQGHKEQQRPLLTAAK